MHRLRLYHLCRFEVNVGEVFTANKRGENAETRSKMWGEYCSLVDIKRKCVYNYCVQSCTFLCVDSVSVPSIGYLGKSQVLFLPTGIFGIISCGGSLLAVVTKFASPLPQFSSLELRREFGKGIKNCKSNSSWSARFDRKFLTSLESVSMPWERGYHSSRDKAVQSESARKFARRRGCYSLHMLPRHKCEPSVICGGCNFLH